jgi:general secretion pathway protein G
MFTKLSNQRGLTLIELVVTMVILSLLASMILPSARMTTTRVKEIELKRNLREIRTALDKYKKDYDKVREEKPNLPPPSGPKSGYPETLEVLVEGKDFGDLAGGTKKYLRRIPTDPFHPVKEGEDPWGMRSYTDDKDSRSWGKEDVYDVYSLSDATAIDGTKYKDW